MANRVRTIIEHLAKLEASPAIEPRAGWQDTEVRAPTEIEVLLEDSPSLRQKLDETLERELVRALRLAASALALHNETARVPLESIRYGAEQVLGLWFPDGPA